MIMEGVLYSRLPFYAFLMRPACGIAFHGGVALFVLGASTCGPDPALVFKPLHGEFTDLLVGPEEFRV